ncbi:hypothetical protein HK102_007842, partial [Quaeritorhiza haematococci]
MHTDHHYPAPASAPGTVEPTASPWPTPPTTIEDEVPPGRAHVEHVVGSGFTIAKELGAGGLANAISSAVLNVFDVIKVRQQLESVSKGPLSSRQYASFRGTAAAIWFEEGLRGLYMPGMAATILRELTYSSLRFGLYVPIKNMMARITSIEHPESSLFIKFSSGMMTGVVGSCVANPTDLVKIRLQGEAGRIGADGLYATGLRAGHKPSYRNTFHAFVDTASKEGVRGTPGPFTLRPLSFTPSFLSSVRFHFYTKVSIAAFKQQHYGEGISLHVAASVIAGLCATTLAAPADLVKTRLLGQIQPVPSPSFAFASPSTPTASTTAVVSTGVVDCFAK